MQPRTCVITGATSGIGRAAAFELARQGFDLGLVCRSRAKGEATAAAIREATGKDRAALIIADLAVQSEVRRAAQEIRDRFPVLHVLVNNAGIVNTSFRESPDGIEESLAVNHLAYFLLTGLLLDHLRASAPARIVSVSSDAHRFGKLALDDLEFRRRGYRSMQVYGTSKLLNLLWTFELARRLEGTGVTANALHPGGVNTGLGDQNGWLLSTLGKVVKVFMRSPEKGAETLVWLAAAPELSGVSGRYYTDLRERKPSAAALDVEAQRRLWDASERLIRR